MKRFIKVISLILAVGIIFGITGCKEFKKDKTEIALVTDIGDIDDKSYNQYTFKGIKKYCDKKHIAYDYYRPQTKEKKNMIKAIDAAVKDGAKLVICPNPVQKGIVEETQNKYPDVKFILLNEKIKNPSSNTYCVDFDELEMGFLAGYTAVKEGYRNLGFQGGKRNLKSQRYGYGFIQGAECAARELNLEIGSISLKYNYSKNNNYNADTQAMAQLWYEGGTQVIFVCERGILASVISVAESEPGRHIIGCDNDRSILSDTVVTSVQRLIEDVVYSSIDSFYSGKFKGGVSETLNCKTGGIDMQLDRGKLKNFSRDDCEKVKNMLANDESSIKNYIITPELTRDIQMETTSDFSVVFSLESVVVEYIVN